MGALGLTGHATQFDRGVPFALAREIIGDLPLDVSDAVADHAAAVRSLLDVTTPDRLLGGTEADRRPRVSGRTCHATYSVRCSTSSPNWPKSKPS